MKSNRKQWKGIPASPGVAIGRTRVLRPGELRVAEFAVPQARITAEIEALDKAVAETITDLKLLRETADHSTTGPVSKIFDAQLLIAGDYEFLKHVKEQIHSERRNAAHVYNAAVEQATLPLKQSQDRYMRQMADEIEAVAHRILARLGGNQEEDDVDFQPNQVLIGKMFTPGQVLTYHHHKAAGFVVAEGGRTSHMALIARSLMAPLVILPDVWAQIPGDAPIIVDGLTGTVILYPTDEEVKEYFRLKRRQGPALITRLKRLENIPPTTSDGVPVTIAANLEIPGPIDMILAGQRIPVGLYRTEFLYLESEDFPDEEQQYTVYRQIADTFSGTQVIIRTFDIGSDKIKSSEIVGDEDNPALGWRGIRSMLEMPDVFRAQIRAILRASVHHNLKIMLPMISDLAEYDRARKIITQVMQDLRRERAIYDPDISIGIMVEVPSAALTANLLAQKVDFISIGTNDLTQYTMSADRTNARVANLYNTYHPSVLQLIKMTVEACKTHRKPVSICGEVAGDHFGLPLFIGMGVEQLSMNPAKIYDMCRLVSRIDSQQARQLTAAVMGSASAAGVMRKLEAFAETLEKK